MRPQPWTERIQACQEAFRFAFDFEILHGANRLYQAGFYTSWHSVVQLASNHSSGRNRLTPYSILFLVMVRELTTQDTKLA
jgi:hypothetical protein